MINKVVTAIIVGMMLWVLSGFHDTDNSLDYVPRNSDYSSNDDSDWFHGDYNDEDGDNSLEYVSRGGRNEGNTLHYRGRSARTGRYVHRSNRRRY